MKDVLRTAISAVVGALVALAVVVGQPALADQAGKAAKAAAKNSVTSKSIKNGTIKTKDLSAEVTGPLAKAGTALQSVPDGSVTTPKLADNAVTNPKIADNAVSSAEIADNAVGSGEVADNAVGSGELADNAVGSGEVANNSLTSSDIAAATGSNAFDFGNLAPAQCAATGPIATGTTVTGDFILVSEPPGIAGNLYFFGREDLAVNTAINIVGCNIGNSAFDAPPTSFSWAVID